MAAVRESGSAAKRTDLNLAPMIRRAVAVFCATSLIISLASVMVLSTWTGVPSALADPGGNGKGNGKGGENGNGNNGNGNGNGGENGNNGNGNGNGGENGNGNNGNGNGGENGNGNGNSNNGNGNGNGGANDSAAQSGKDKQKDKQN